KDPREKKLVGKYFRYCFENERFLCLIGVVYYQARKYTTYSFVHRPGHLSLNMGYLDAYVA
ncbi:hypothetical protein HMI54_012819, partial [Coelomomyces lativittatus]